MTPTHKEPENCLEENQEQSDCKSDSPLINDDVSPRIPFILIDGPGGGLDQFLLIYFNDF